MPDPVTDFTDFTGSTEEAVVGQSILRWSSRTNTLAGIEAELAKVWSSTQLMVQTDNEGHEERRVAARTSVLNLVVIARQPEIGAKAASIIRMLTGRHPSRTMIVSSADPDGPSWLDAHVQAHCVLPRADAAETCAEFIDLVAGGEAGRHVAAIVAPLLVHDLPVTLWWPGDPPLGTRQARDMLDMADRLVVDGSEWSGDGLDRLRSLARLVDEDHAAAGAARSGPARAGSSAVTGAVAVSDFALLRQSRWREAIASTFDRADLRPFLGSLTDITVRYATHPGSGARATNVIKPLYHVGWLASRLGLEVSTPLAPVIEDRASETGERGVLLSGELRARRRRVRVAIAPVESPMPAGTTLTVELAARRRGVDLSVIVSAEAEAVIVEATVDGRAMPPRRFMAPRRTDVELLAESVESVGTDPVAVAALLTAAKLVASR